MNIIAFISITLLYFAVHAYISYKFIKNYLKERISKETKKELREVIEYGKV